MTETAYKLLNACLILKCKDLQSLLKIQQIQQIFEKSIAIS
jgi:hypothetical protein